jgi:hypothetical protein
MPLGYPSAWVAAQCINDFYETFKPKEWDGFHHWEKYLVTYDQALSLIPVVLNKVPSITITGTTIRPDFFIISHERLYPQLH